MFALYQALYEEEPDKFVAEQTVFPNKVNASSELAPYVKAEGTNQPCYTSNQVKDWTVLGFATPGNKKLTPDGRNELAKYIRDTYLW